MSVSNANQHFKMDSTPQVPVILYQYASSLLFLMRYSEMWYRLFVSYEASLVARKLRNILSLKGIPHYRVEACQIWY